MLHVERKTRNLWITQKITNGSLFYLSQLSRFYTNLLVSWPCKTHTGNTRHFHPANSRDATCQISPTNHSRAPIYQPVPKVWSTFHSQHTQPDRVLPPAHTTSLLSMEFHRRPQLTKSSAEDSKSVDRDNLKPSGKRKLWQSILSQVNGLLCQFLNS